MLLMNVSMGPSIAEISLRRYKELYLYGLTPLNLSYVNNPNNSNLNVCVVKCLIKS